MSTRSETPTFIFDIDQTLAGGLMLLHLQHYNRSLSLEMSEAEILEASQTYAKTFDVPQIIDYRKENEEKFQNERAYLRTSPDLHRALAPIDGAKAGIDMLSAYASDIRYYSVRPQEVTEATTDWLHVHAFISAAELVICVSPKDKLERVVEIATKKGTQVVLIDDSLKDLLNAAVELAAEASPLVNDFSQLTLVGFGYDDPAVQELLANRGESIGIEVCALPSWETGAVMGLIAKLQFVPIPAKRS
ncbi:MAG: hypothetical protein ABI758_01730 [Candidatus Woesebacteria bacterium]